MMYGCWFLQHHYERVSFQEKIRNLIVTERNDVKYNSSCVFRPYSLFVLQIEIESILYTSYFLFRVMLPVLEMANVKFL